MAGFDSTADICGFPPVWAGDIVWLSIRLELWSFVRRFVPFIYSSENDHTAVIIKITEMLLRKMKISIRITFTDPVAYPRDTSLPLEHCRGPWESWRFQRQVDGSLKTPNLDVG